ncbi:MAG: phosphonate ABC transporter ATP-binding protein [Actinomycetota bacterium]|nr:phosphonate ABC transporter ATP-binding protein [Actinomycetota bacterium]
MVTSQLRKEFDGGRVVALDDVNLTVPEGQLAVIIGLSGSGKSTFLRHLNKLHEPTSGDVEVLGVDLARAHGRELRRLRRDVGFIFQQFNLVGRLTCLENVLTGALGRLRGPRYGVLTYPVRLRREALEHLERVGLGDRAFQRTDTLSGGQQQRVAIARALMQRPKLMLADEPVASLDPESSAQVMEMLFRICSEDRLTVLCSLHQVDLALGWAQRIIGLRDGRVVLDRDATGLSQDDAMAVYQRLDPTGEKTDEYEQTWAAAKDHVPSPARPVATGGS